MNMLVIGNGFDIALGLPTKYTDFLDFSLIFDLAYNHEAYKNDKKFSDCIVSLDKRIDDYPDKVNQEKLVKAKDKFMRFNEAFENELAESVSRDFHYCIYKNRWIEYFRVRYDKNLVNGENWIDLEIEIKNVIKILESDIFDVKERHATEHELSIKNPVEKIISELTKQMEQGRKYAIPLSVYKELKKSLRNEFDKFVMALGIYLDFFVRLLGNDINTTTSRDVYRMVHGLDIIADRILSFNYINNYNERYSGKEQTEDNTCYVHGAVNYTHEIKEAMKSNGKTWDIKTFIPLNKMIIGFDEYLDDKRKNVKMEFVYYRKYFQRISKGTGSQYIDWLNEYMVVNSEQDIFHDEKESHAKIHTRPQNEKDKPNHVIIFGHSLDPTDGDIFKDIFLREPNDTKVTIYYHDDEAHDRIIVNLISILSQEVLIQKTHGANPDIEFKKQLRW